MLFHWNAELHITAARGVLEEAHSSGFVGDRLQIKNANKTVGTAERYKNKDQ